MPRLDTYVVEKKLAPSREKAKEYIKTGRITVNGIVVDKPAFDVSENDIVVYTGEAERYVGRGGFKLEKAIEEFKISLDGCVCLDIGASTGGFTDCMLQNGASKVYAVDVGHGQLAKKLVDDSRVVNIEGVNVKSLTGDIVKASPDFVAADVSFISVLYAADAAYKLMRQGSEAVFLIKPQFEAGKSNLSKGGIVKDKKVHIDIISRITDSLCNIGFSVDGLIPSPIKGGDGNIEYLVHVIKSESVVKKNFDYIKIVAGAFGKQ